MWKKEREQQIKTKEGGRNSLTGGEANPFTTLHRRTLATNLTLLAIRVDGRTAARCTTRASIVDRSLVSLLLPHTHTPPGTRGRLASVFGRLLSLAVVNEMLSPGSRSGRPVWWDDDVGIPGTIR